MTRDERKHSDHDLPVHEFLGDLAEEPVPDLAPRVMSRIEALSVSERGQRGAAHRAPGPARSRLRAALLWLWRPRQVTLPVRPAVVAATAVAVVAVWIGLPASVQRDADGPAVVAGADGTAATGASVFVQFRLDVLEARDVRLAGDFTDWQPAHELRQVAPGVWTVVVPLQPGVHEYAFVIDGDRWTADPLAEQVTDGFGGVNSRVAVLIPERSEA